MLNTQELADRILTSARTSAAQKRTIRQDVSGANQIHLNRLQDEFDATITSICNLFSAVATNAPAFTYAEKRDMASLTVSLGGGGSTNRFEAEVCLVGGSYRSLNGGDRWMAETWDSTDVPKMSVLIELSSDAVRAPDSYQTLSAKRCRDHVTFHQLSFKLERWLDACLSTLPAAKQS